MALFKSFRICHLQCFLVLLAMAETFTAPLEQSLLSPSRLSQQLPASLLRDKNFRPFSIFTPASIHFQLLNIAAVTKISSQHAHLTFSAINKVRINAPSPSNGPHQSCRRIFRAEPAPPVQLWALVVASFSPLIRLLARIWEPTSTITNEIELLCEHFLANASRSYLS